MAHLMTTACKKLDNEVPFLSHKWITKVTPPINSINVVTAVTSALITSFLRLISFALLLKYLAGTLAFEGRICLEMFIKRNNFQRLPNICTCKDDKCNGLKNGHNSTYLCMKRKIAE